MEGTFEETRLSDLRAQFATNVFGVAATLQAALPYMRQRRAGHLIVVTSMGGLMAVRNFSRWMSPAGIAAGHRTAIGHEL